ncbi:MAG: META domain-containing protein, partial [Paludibacteraceae bacterium]|nr:META domain-containing protein [Paludibacteraceae bacterium]
FFGEFNTTENKNDITISNLGSTKKLCVDMTTEDAIFSAFSQVASVEYDNNNMKLKDNNGKILMELSPIAK